MEITVSEKCVGLRVRVRATGEVGMIYQSLPRQGQLDLVDPDDPDRESLGRFTPDGLEWPDEGIVITYRGDDQEMTATFRRYREAARLLVNCIMFENLTLVRVELSRYHLDDLSRLRFGSGGVLPDPALVRVRPEVVPA